ncbi:MAG: M23 family peptidase, partial [Alphaproteobacteria bacterium]|nr:M23 family peptidase [Alphaproteobacteria bacterium]
MRRAALPLALVLLLLAAPLGAGEISLNGGFIQGGLVRGAAPPGSAVSLDGRQLRLSPEGFFVFGFGRDAAGEAVLIITYPGGEEETRRFAIASRQYDIQHIEGLPQKMVTPPPELLARIREEGAIVRAARAFDTA